MRIFLTSFVGKILKLLPLILVFVLTVQSAKSQTVKTVGATGADFPTLKAAFDAINAGAITGGITLQIIASTTEPNSAVLNASGTGSANYSTILIHPTVTGVSITGAIAAPLIDLNGADNVTINGSTNPPSGTDKGLTLANTSTSSTTGTCTLRFINGATTNTIKNCYIKGGTTDPAAGILFFSTAGASSGNTNNLITADNISSNSDANRPLNAIYSVGSASYPNNNKINGNSIYNFLNPTTASNGIFLGDNNTGWLIKSNNFYESTTFSCNGTQAYNIIYINNSGTGYTVQSNNIGGTNPSFGGLFTKTGGDNTFNVIYISTGTSSASTIVQNTIASFSWTNTSSATWTAMNVAAGNVTVGGSAAGNTIGASNGTGSITLNGGATGAAFYGINIASAATVDCQYNIIGGITVAANSAADATNFFGINKTATAGSTTISNNTIGSTSAANSINASSASTGQAQTVQGIVSAGTGSVTLSGNTIANLTNGTTNTSGSVTGIDYNGSTTAGTV